MTGSPYNRNFGRKGRDIALRDGSSLLLGAGLVLDGPNRTLSFDTDSLSDEQIAAIAAIAAGAAAETVHAGLTATGTTQGTALVLSASINVFSTVAANTGCIIAATTRQRIFNLGANDLKVYPFSGHTIQNPDFGSLVMNDPIVCIASGGRVELIPLSSTTWLGV